MNTTAQQAGMILKMMGMRYAPRPMPWSDPSQPPETSRQIAELWQNLMTQYNFEAVMSASERICQENPEWAPNLNQFSQTIQEEARRVMRELAQTQRLTGAVTCDGNSWIHIDEDRPQLGMRPCKHCNPWLYQQWLDNTHEDFVGRDIQREQKKWLDNHTMPPTCKGVVEPARPIPPSEGIQIAKAAYLQEIDRLNREQPLYDKHGNETPRIPDTKKFDHFINAVTPTQ